MNLMIYFYSSVQETLDIETRIVFVVVFVGLFFVFVWYLQNIEKHLY